ncbi:MAG: hypothetical protein DWQ51_01625 [Microcystis wesenbergii TW10]|uniref:Uncharacterized protein n=2 Tax=Microcystis TaxID=1125 RepID=A0A551YPA2_MICAE|nr:MAG: hypothetical protein DWQ51_01625 [Microcystis wesenbergii TW10]TRT62679.1 MAG: hypothetical protein EWV85_00100 [Microcystis aeruginosa Ma_QC_C_20070703_M131]TRT67431.1 MAG: hypothetical protein EWV67_04405 [Microcystis sp. M_QC_C_20170808_M2Col]TRT70645.1 MAG: hypothetical protein EWV68_06335 [Microcystis sp. M_QC_C_20170808_M9Col]TRT95313.1 MAG: hypothetical protein EWV62_14905 [Microcystis aeruginosa Ma_OC_LR_19540900_S633]TRU10403.1 MAG: hypothetical protein EWV59_12185 [Microcysti
MSQSSDSRYINFVSRLDLRSYILRKCFDVTRVPLHRIQLPTILEPKNGSRRFFLAIKYIELGFAFRPQSLDQE